MIDLFAEHQDMLEALKYPLSLVYQPAVSMLANAVNTGQQIVVYGEFAPYMSRVFLTPQFAEPIPCFNVRDGYASFLHTGDAAVVFANGAQTDDFVHTARRKGATTLGLTGPKGMTSRPDIEIRVPSGNTQRLNESYIFLVHLLLDGVKFGITKTYATERNA